MLGVDTVSYPDEREEVLIFQVNILYTHKPDPDTPVEESARAFDKHFRAGRFKEAGGSGNEGLLTDSFSAWALQLYDGSDERMADPV